MAEQRLAEHKRLDVDAHSGMATTGHVWDGIQELNTPLPRWWLWVFYATIIWSIGYWIVYPSWPLISSYTKGAFDWQSREAVVRDLADLKATRGPMMDKLATASLAEIAADPLLSDFAFALGRVSFADNCAPCHGPGAGGNRGYPNLIDDEWLWGGKLEDIATTIRFGIRSTHANARPGAMPAFGRDNMLKRAEIEAVTDYTRSIAGLPVDPKADLVAGKKVFATTCATCHGDDGKGKLEIGSPDLTDAIWLYGSDRAAIFDGLWNGRAGVMPAWVGRLDDSTIKALTVYVSKLAGAK